MFKRPQTNVIQSDEGFSVEVLGRTGLRYTEGLKTLFIDSEILNGPSGLGIYTSSIRSWDPPYDNEVIDDAKRAAIVDNVRRAFRFRGLEIDVM
jgi:hypothetical protein